MAERMAEDSPTQQARRVLRDVVAARERLEDEPGWVEWRLYWVAALALIRAVGHVLVKFDGGRSPHVRDAANELHRKWKGRSSDHAIFRNFIEQERNSILKEYEWGMSEGPVPIMTILQNPLTGEVKHSGVLIEENVYRPMQSGPYEGEDGRTLLDDAIEWWEQQLDAVDQEVQRRLNSPKPRRTKRR